MHQEPEPEPDATAGPSVDVACVGETMALLVPEPGGADPARRYRLDVGGAESNVAVHLARLGHRVSWHSVLGADEFAQHITTHLTEEGVHCVVRTDPQRCTGLYVKEITPGGTQMRYYRAGSAASTLAPDDATGIWGRAPRLVHTTGITAALSTDATALVRTLLRDVPVDAPVGESASPGQGPSPGPLRSFDVNYRPALHGSPRCDSSHSQHPQHPLGSPPTAGAPYDGEATAPEYAALLHHLAQSADVVFCGLDEAAALWNTSTVTEVRALLDRPDLVVVKQGADGVTALGRTDVHAVPAPQVEVVEPVGAGDAFAAGVLHGLLSGAGIRECLAVGTRLAGTVLGVDGDVPPRAAPAGGRIPQPGGDPVPRNRVEEGTADVE
ncbi:sugar kinase [Lipingzhangella rawalii]|uniref:sugar kinase n=1 Tax=Lipingzhangella rawalii TaxID=2055835 RepID=UPI00287B7CF3|nr:sugar kinase [Lipingzhangella rawalii]